MKHESYLEALAAHLQRRGVEESTINEIVSEAESHLAESGEPPEEAFGPADDYAERMALHEESSAGPAGDGEYLLRTFRATAFSEMTILELAGREGWELVDVGPLALFCRRPRDESRIARWEYKRRTGRHEVAIREEMTRDRWEPCGNWVLFHYFKRKMTS